MNFDKPVANQIEHKIPPTILPEDIGNDVPSDLIPKNFTFENIILSDEQKKMLLELGIAPIKKEYIPKFVYRGVLNSRKTKKLKDIVNQLNTFYDYVKSTSVESNIDDFLEKISFGFFTKRTSSGISFNWFGVTLFTSPNKSVCERYCGSNYGKKPGGFVTKFLVKKENPVIISKADAKKIIKDNPKTFEELKQANKKLVDLGVDGIMYDSDGNAIAWLNPFDNLDVKEVYQRLFKEHPINSEFEDVSLYLKE